MSGLVKRWMKFRAMLISTIQNISMRHWNMFMVLSHLDPRCFPVRIWTKLITNQNKILERWAEQFSAVLSCPSSINDEAIQHLPQVPVNHELNLLPTLGETQKAISQLSNGKVSGADPILAKVYNMADLYCIRSWSTSSSPYGSKVLYCKTSRTHLPFISTREKEIANSVTITTAYHSCP